MSRPKKVFKNEQEELVYKRFQRVFFNMRRRCLFEYDSAYKHYGGRGIKISKNWTHFYQFEKDMWDVYEKRIKELGNKRGLTTLDRIDVDGDYCKENCRWVSMAVQARNKRAPSKDTLKYKGNQAGIKYSTLRGRLSTGWSLERALTEPVKSKSI